MIAIAKIENHPDRVLDEIFGPFETWEEAEAVADRMRDHRSNWNGSHRLYTFHLFEMMATTKEEW